MKTGTVIRQGRTVAVNNNDTAAWCFRVIILPIVCVSVFFGGVAYLAVTERHFQHQQAAFVEVKGQVLKLTDNDADTVSEMTSSTDRNLVYFTGAYNSTVGDADFGVRFGHALKLHRQTEYCQWDESSREECDTCTRKDGDGNDETYKCNCRRTYYYVKTWRSRRIPSLMFDQPANHHNPLRDPFPSTDVFSGDIEVGSLLLSSGVVQNLRAPMHPVTFSVGGKSFEPGFLTRMWHKLVGEPVVRFESKERLAGLLSSRAYTREQFVFTNTWEGWFFSAYDAPNWQKIVRGFGQFFEGSLFDWQIGDLYDIYNGCNPGDLRSRFFVADPSSVSVIAEVSHEVSWMGHRTFKVVPYVASNEFKIGIVHDGERGPDELFARETQEAHNNCYFARMFCLLSGAALTYLMVHFDLWRPSGSPVVYCGVAVGITLTLVSLVWLVFYGLLGCAMLGATGASMLAGSLWYDFSMSNVKDARKVA